MLTVCMSMFALFSVIVFLIHTFIYKETNDSMPMKELTNSMIGVCDELQNQNKNRIESLEIFINCKDMVRWLQENIKSNLNPKNNIVIVIFISLSDIYDFINKKKCMNDENEGKNSEEFITCLIKNVI